MRNWPLDISALEWFLQQHEEYFPVPSVSPSLMVVLNSNTPWSQGCFSCYSGLTFRGHQCQHWNWELLSPGASSAVLSLNMATAFSPSLSPGRWKCPGFLAHRVRRRDQLQPRYSGSAGMFLLRGRWRAALAHLHCTCCAMGKQQPAAKQLHWPQQNRGPNTGMDHQ